MRLILTLMLLCLCINEASAEDFHAQIFNSKNADLVKSFVCSSNAMPCLSLEPLPAEPPFKDVIVACVFTRQDAQCKFARDTIEIPINPEGYALISIPLDKNGNGAESIALFKPETTEQGMLRRWPVMRPGKILAELEITVHYKE